MQPGQDEAVAAQTLAGGKEGQVQRGPGEGAPLPAVPARSSPVTGRESHDAAPAGQAGTAGTGGQPGLPKPAIPISAATAGEPRVTPLAAAAQPVPSGVRSPFQPVPAEAVAAAPRAAPSVPVQQEALPSAPPRQGGSPAGLAEATPAAADTPASARPPGGLAQDVAAPPALASLLIPAEPGVGAAAFRRGDVAVVVLDSPAVVDEARLRRVTGLAGATLRPAVGVLVLEVPGPPAALSLVREARGWRLSAAEPSGAAIEAVPSGDGTLFRQSQPGRAVTIADPATGGVLLVGTSSPAVGPASRLPARRGAPDAAALPAWAGMAVEPFADAVELRAVADGFILGDGSRTASAVSAPAQPGAAVALPGAAALTRRFDLPDQPVPALMQRLRAAMAGAAAAPPRARTPGRIAVAQAMLALGMAAEAQSVLALALADDPAAAGNPDVAGLSAIAALLTGRMEATAGLDAPALDGTDEAALWRGVRDAVRGQDTPAVRGLPALMPLALSYPAPLRDRVLPVVAETAVLAGGAGPDTLPDTLLNLPRLGFARALQLERRGAGGCGAGGL